jgi:murein DD-endopeptidase MepM/ murein hydrolase activator NlpD
MNNHSHTIYTISVLFFSSIVAFLMMMLLWEYRFFCRQNQELEQVKQQYYGYVDELQKKLGYEKKIDFIENDSQDIQDVDVEGIIVVDEGLVDEGNDEEIVQDEEYARAGEHTVFINRQPEYLKESTLEYLKTEELNSLMTALDMEQWTDYTEQVAAKPQQKHVVKKSSKRAQAPKKIQPLRHVKKEVGLVWPIDKGMFWLSSLFGPRKRINGTWGFHHGIDMAATKGTAVKAARQGTVVEVGLQKGYGNTVVIQHSGFLKTRYAHLNSVRVHQGQSVKQGAFIGTVGDTGFVRRQGKDGSHLHFEVYERDTRINPLHCLARIT